MNRSAAYISARTLSCVKRHIDFLIKPVRARSEPVYPMNCTCINPEAVNQKLTLAEIINSDFLIW